MRIVLNTWPQEYIAEVEEDRARGLDVGESIAFAERGFPGRLKVVAVQLPLPNLGLPARVRVVEP